MKSTIQKALDVARIYTDDQNKIMKEIRAAKISKEQTTQIVLLIRKAKETTKLPESRFVLIYEWIHTILYPKCTEQEMNDINIHLKAMSMLRSHQGTDSTDSERNMYQLIEDYHYNEIKQINAGFYSTIIIQKKS